MAFKDKAKAAAYNKEYKAVWYKENRKRLIAKDRERRIELRKWFNGFKLTLKCERCSFSHPAALDFHHKDGEEKENCVTTLVGLGYCKERILEEIAKCEVLCSNCHRILHYEQNGDLV